MCVHLFRQGGRRASVAINGNGSAKGTRTLFVSPTRDDLFASRSSSPRFAEIGIGWIRRAEMVIASLRRLLLSSSNRFRSIVRARVCVYLRARGENFSPRSNMRARLEIGDTQGARWFLLFCALWRRGGRTGFFRREGTVGKCSSGCIFRREIRAK